VKLLGLEAEILLKMAKDEHIIATTASLKNAMQRLRNKGLLTDDGLTEFGKSEAEWRSRIIDGLRDVYDLKPGGGYLREYHFLYEPITYFSYAWNWCGLHGVSIVKTDPRKGTTFFEAAGTSFWIEGKTLTPDSISFNMPTSKTTEKWAKGEIVSLSAGQIWDINDFYFRFFLDFKEDCYYDVLNLAAFQSFLIVDEYLFNSCFFIGITGAYGGGKSVSCEALVFLGRHGKVANPSVAWVGRNIERLGLTIFLDEFDIIVESDPEMGRLARMCQRRGQTYDRSTKSGESQSYDAFGPWIMSIHGKIEDALATRTIPLTVQETDDPDVPVVNPEKSWIAEEIYDQMWMWYMDNLDYVSYSSQENKQVDFNLKTIMNELSLAVSKDGGVYVTVDDRSNFDQVDIIEERTQDITYIDESNMTNMANRSNVGKHKIHELRKKVAESILSSCTEKQRSIIRRAAGRNIELMVTAFKIMNVVGVDRDDALEKAFEIKRETEEEDRQIGTIGYVRDLLVSLYKKRREHANYWTKDGLFMVTNLEIWNELNPFLHRREQAGITQREFGEALKELGFIRPTSRRKMGILTWDELQDGKEGKHVRLANIYTETVQRKLNMSTEMPDFGQKTLKDQFQAPPSRSVRNCSNCGTPLNAEVGELMDNRTNRLYCRQCFTAMKEQGLIG